MTKSGYF